MIFLAPGPCPGAALLRLCRRHVPPAPGVRGAPLAAEPPGRVPGRRDCAGIRRRSGQRSVTGHCAPGCRVTARANPLFSIGAQCHARLTRPPIQKSNHFYLSSFPREFANHCDRENLSSLACPGSRAESRYALRCVRMFTARGWPNLPHRMSACTASNQLHWAWWVRGTSRAPPRRRRWGRLERPEAGSAVGARDASPALQGMPSVLRALASTAAIVSSASQ